MDKAAILDFLTSARARTYAGGAEPDRTDPSGAKVYELQEGDLRYRDGYLDDEVSFLGQETLHLQGEPVWTMVYAGQVMLEAAGEPGAAAIYSFLQRALAATIADSRLGGEADYAEGDWRYEDCGESSGSEFWGDETVTLQGVEVYRLRYGGGWIE